jgi:hypothetical protein
MCGLWPAAATPWPHTAAGDPLPNIDEEGCVWDSAGSGGTRLPWWPRYCTQNTTAVSDGAWAAEH